MDFINISHLLEEIEFTARVFNEYKGCDILSPTEEELSKEAKTLYVELKILLGRLATATGMNMDIKNLEVINESR